MDEVSSKSSLAGVTAQGRRIPGGYYQRRRVSNRLSFMFLAAPALAWYAALMAWPIVNMFYISLLRWEGLLLPKRFIGLENFQRLLADTHFWNAAANTGIHLLVSVPGTLLPAFMLGFFLSQRRPGYRLLRVIYFSPGMLSLAVAAMTFQGIYLPQGLLNGLLRAVGLAGLAHTWLADPQTALGAIIALDLWGGIGWNAVLFFAALSEVSEELYEAARLDGAHPWTVMWRIAFPITLDFFGVLAVLGALWVLLGSGGIVYLLTKGGPGDASLTLSYMVLQQGLTPSTHLGYSQAIAVVLFVLGFISLLLIRRLTRPDWARG